MHARPSQPFLPTLLLAILALLANPVALLADPAAADEPLKLKAMAPADQAIVGSKPGGFYYVAKPLQAQHDLLVDKLNSLRELIVSGQSSREEADRAIRVLEAQLESVRALVDSSKTFIATGTISVQNEVTKLSLGPENLIFLADMPRVRLIGWDLAQVSCVIEKTVISDGKQPVDEQFAAIKLVHRHGPAPDVVGRTPEVMQAEKEKFFKSLADKNPTAKQLAAVEVWWNANFGPQSYFRQFQGKQVDCIEIEGLTHQQGNRQVEYEINSPGGDRTLGSTWQRNAMVTIYVPNCIALGLQGGLSGLECDGLRTALIVRGDGNPDYSAVNSIKNHRGSLTAESIPLHFIDNVEGDVNVTITADVGNSGSNHRRSQRSQYVDSPGRYDFRNIHGNLTANLLRATLHVSDINGRIDVTNDFGSTELSGKQPLFAAAHRLSSESGRIRLKLSPEALATAPLLAATECGEVRVADGFPELEEKNLSFWTGPEPLLRKFRGFSSKVNDPQPFLPFGRFSRLQPALPLAEPLGPGLDVVTRSGTIYIERPAE